MTSIVGTGTIDEGQRRKRILTVGNTYGDHLALFIMDRDKTRQDA